MVVESPKHKSGFVASVPVKSIEGATRTIWPTCSDEHPSGLVSVIVKPTEKIPDSSKIWVTFWPVAEAPSPKSQVYVASAPEFEKVPDPKKSTCPPGQTNILPSVSGAGVVLSIDPVMSWQGS